MPFSHTMRALLASAAVASTLAAPPLARVQRRAAATPDKCLDARHACGNYVTCCAGGGYKLPGRGDVCSKVAPLAKTKTCDTMAVAINYPHSCAALGLAEPTEQQCAAIAAEGGPQPGEAGPPFSKHVGNNDGESGCYDWSKHNIEFMVPAGGKMGQPCQIMSGEGACYCTKPAVATPVFEFAGPAARLQGAAAVAEQSRPDLQLAKDFTASIWVMPTRRVNDWARVFGKGSSHSRNFGLWIHPDGRVLSQVYGPSSPNVWNVKGATAPLDTWTHIAATFSKDKLHTLYINGAKVGSLATKGTPRTDNEPVTIGKAAFHTGFEGSLARASLMGVAMTAEEVKAQYEAAKGDMVVPDVVCAASQYREGSAPGKCVDLTGPRYLGCYTDDGHRDLQDGPRRYGFKPDTCAAACKAYKYFALQDGGWCVCGNAYATEAKYTKRPDTECNKGFARGGGAWRNAVFANNGQSTATDTSGAVDFELGATVTTTNAAGSILGKAFPTGLWKNGGAAGQGKMLFLRGGKACFDIGWVGVVCGKTNVADGKPHSVAVKFRYGQYHVVVDGKVEGSGLRAIKDHPQTTWVHGKQIGHAGRPGDMAPDFVGTITGAAYAKLPVCEDTHADCPSLKAMCGHAWLGKEVSAGCPLTCRTCPM